MTDPTALDERARAAAAALRTAAGTRPIPTFDPERRTLPAPAPAAADHRRLRLLAVAAAAVVLLAGAVVWAVARGGDDDATPATRTTDEPRGFLAEDPPAGLRLAGAGEVTRADVGEAASAAAAPLVVYGPDEADPRVGLSLFEGATVTDIASDGESIEVGGHAGRLFVDQGYGPLAIGVELDGSILVGVGAGVDQDDLVAMLAAATVVGGRPEVPASALPAGWRHLGELPSLLGLTSPVVAGRSAAGPSRLAYYVRGASAEAAREFAVVQSTDGDQLDLQAMRLVTSAPEGLEVRGHPGLIGRVTYPNATADASGTSVAAEGWMVSWIEAPGELVRASVVGLSRADAVAFAEALAPVDEDRWRDVIDETSLGGFDLGGAGDGGQVVGEGRFADGTRWRLLVAAAAPDEATSAELPELTLRVTDTADSNTSTSGGSSTVGPDGEVIASTDPVDVAFPSRSVVRAGDRTFVYGLLGDRVDRVRLVGDGGAEVDVPIVEGSGVRAFVAEVTGATATVVARSADGSVLASWAVDETGAIEGPEQTIPTPTTR